MRTKIDYGIDLGTTNSAIARMENGVPVIKKTDTLKDTLPSCVNFNPKKDILVGDPAFNTLRTDRTRALKNFKKESGNTYIEFKRTMGTNTRYPSDRMGREFSSEELSAEVLKRLKSFVSDDTVRSIVITVPAKFTMVQKEATVQAGKLAGFQHIELLQEPIAASMAYGLNASNKDGIWLVFDFGGGTFDAALIRVEEGIMQVMDTEGDNWLGGQNLDKAIVDEIILPYLEKNYAIAKIMGDKDKKEILRNAVKAYAEECKIQMSFNKTHNILSDLGELPFEDENGEEPMLDITVDEAKMEMVIGPIFQKAIDICKELLQRNNLRGANLTTLLLVGGPTYSPILRRLLKEQITENLNTNTDPMTSVAKGAALFAATLDVAADIIEETRDRTKIQLELDYEATTVETEETIKLRVLKQQTQGNIPDKIFAEVVRGDKAWSSGKKPIGERPALIDVFLNTGASNSFTIVLYDDKGDKLDCQPDTFNILQGINPGQGATLPYHIGIEITDRALERDVFIPAKGLEKNKPLPATGVITGRKTQRPLRPGMKSDFFVIPIYQGEHQAEGTRAIYNEHVNDVRITGENLPALLPEGSDVEITVKVDRSETMTLFAFFPYLNHTEEIPVNLIQKSQVDEAWLLSEIQQAQKTVREVGKTTSTAQTNSVSENLGALERQLQNEKGSTDGKFKVLENLRKELRLLDRLQQETEWPLVEKELKQEFFDLEDLIRKIKANGDWGQFNMEKIDMHINEYRVKVDQAIRSQDIRLARDLASDIRSMDFQIRNEVTGNGMEIAFLQSVNANFDSYNWRDRNKARVLCQTGLQLVASGKHSQLRPVLLELIGLMPEDEKPTDKLN